MFVPLFRLSNRREAASLCRPHIMPRRPSAVVLWRTRLRPAFNGVGEADIKSLACQCTSRYGVRSALRALRRAVIRRPRSGPRQHPSLRDQHREVIHRLAQKRVLGDSGHTPPPGARTVTAWRAKIDRDFTRFYKVDLTSSSYWVAQNCALRRSLLGNVNGLGHHRQIMGIPRFGTT